MTRSVCTKKSYIERKDRRIKMGRLVIDGETVYELDETCLKEKEEEKRKTSRKTEKETKKGKEIRRK